MARTNALISSFNRGLVSRKALARVDLERISLSAEVYRNWLPKTQGSMSLRPGTKHFGSSKNDTGAAWIEFVASTDDVAILELTDGVMRVWLGDDAHDLALLERPPVTTTVSLADTGWFSTSTGGTYSTPAIDVIPTMTDATTNGVTITASSQNASLSRHAWCAADDSTSTFWQDTGAYNNSLPSWWNVDFGSATSDRKAITSYSIRTTPHLDNSPRSWRFLTGNYDTGTYASDTGKWTLEDERSAQENWSSLEQRTYRLPGADTGTIPARRHWRLHFTGVDTGVPDRSLELNVAEIEMFTALTSQQVKSSGGARIFNATATGSMARLEKRVPVDTGDLGVEHSLAITVATGPVRLRVGSSQRDDDYIREASLGTGYHNLAFTPSGDFWITFQNQALVNRIVSSLSIGDSGTVEITAPWTHDDLDNIRHDQSADVVYVDCYGVRPQKIERRGTGRSWSVVDYAPNNGPFLTAASSQAKLSVSNYYGNTTLNSDIPFFTPEHVGSLIRIFHEGQKGRWVLGAANAKTDVIEVTGISDTGAPTPTSERRITFSVSGTYTGRITIERSIDGPDYGFKAMSGNFSAAHPNASDTGTFEVIVDDTDDNIKAYYRARVADTGVGYDGYTSGAAVVDVKYRGGGKTGVAKITGYTSNTSVSIEVIDRFTDTGSSENWQEGYWSEARGYPMAVVLHGGRLAHAVGGTLFLSVSDDYENFSSKTIGDAGPIIRTLGSGPVDDINYLASTLRLLIGTVGAEIALTTSSLDETPTPTNTSARNISTQGSANVRAVVMDNRIIMVQRSKQRIFMIGPGAQTGGFGEYEAFELTLLVPDLLASGVRSIAIQRQPDTRLHCVLEDGTVGIMTYEPQEKVLCWSTWETDGIVERAMVLPGISEDAVYYHINRTINGQTKRFFEKWAMESECLGDTGLSWLADCASSFTDTGRTNTLRDIAPHLPNESVVLWGSLDTGSTPHVDLSPHVNGVQTLYTVDTGGDIAISLSSGLHHAVAGLPYQADWRSTKLAYGAQAGTGLAQKHRVAQIAFVLYQTHNRGLLFGNDTGRLGYMPQIFQGETIDPDAIFEAFDEVSMNIEGRHSTDARIHLRAFAPRPCTVLAAIPSVGTFEKV